MATETTKQFTISLPPNLVEMAKEKSKDIFYKSNLSGYIKLLIERDNQK